MLRICGLGGRGDIFSGNTGRGDVIGPGELGESFLGDTGDCVGTLPPDGVGSGRPEGVGKGRPPRGGILGTVSIEGDLTRFEPG